MGDVRDILKNNLVFYTKSKQITQKELSDRLGVTQSAVSHWFKGDNSPNIEVVSKIAEILSVPMSALLSESDSHSVAETKHSPSTDKAAPGEELREEIIRLAGKLSEEQQDLFLALLRLTAARNQGLPAADLVSAGEAALKAEHQSPT